MLLWKALFEWRTNVSQTQRMRYYKRNKITSRQQDKFYTNLIDKHDAVAHVTLLENPGAKW
jgi:hypothetical protein